MLIITILSIVFLIVESASSKLVPQQFTLPLLVYADVIIGNPSIFVQQLGWYFFQHYCIYPNQTGHQADYYWRDYYGVVPTDAVPGGYKVDGTITYIGQMSHLANPGMYPGTIYAGEKEGVICEVKRFADASHVKILCSNPRNKFEWIKTTADDSSLLTDYYWVIGGNQPGAVFNIGRVNFEGEVQVGRVYNSKSPNKGLWICNKAGSQTNFQSFELLVLTR